MSDLEPRRTGSRISRRDRASRAYRLTLATGGLGLAAVAGFVLAALDVVGAGLPILLAILAVACGFLLRRTVSGR